jgi:hypothetical protein
MDFNKLTREIRFSNKEQLSRSSRIDLMACDTNLASMTDYDEQIYEIISGTNGIYNTMKSQVNALNLIYKGNFLIFFSFLFKFYNNFLINIFS